MVFLVQNQLWSVEASTIYTHTHTQINCALRPWPGTACWWQASPSYWPNRPGNRNFLHATEMGWQYRSVSGMTMKRHVKCWILKIQLCLKLAGMWQNSVLKLWRLAGIKVIHDFCCDSALIGRTLVNMVGLGKTWTTIGYLLLVSSNVPMPLSLKVPYNGLASWCWKWLSGGGGQCW